MNTTIILTSTVNVNMRKLALDQIDKNDRIETYLKSVRQWLTKTNFNIVLVENSGHSYDELNEEKAKYEHRFDVITFMENETEEDKFLTISNSISKGESEMFAINYAFHRTRLIKPDHFIIKITARYFIPELEEYLGGYDLSKYDCLTQNNRDRCEMVGSHYRNFYCMFNAYLINRSYRYEGHVENIWKDRTSIYNNILICKEFSIDATRMGGCNSINTII